MLEIVFEFLLPIHPKLVHFPIALIWSAFLIYGLGLLLKNDSFCQAAWVMFVMMVLSMPIVILSGLCEVWRLDLDHPVLDIHQLFGYISLGVCVVGLVLLYLIRQKDRKLFRFVFMVILMLLVSMITLTAFYGGRMVFECGIGAN